MGAFSLREMKSLLRITTENTHTHRNEEIEFLHFRDSNSSGSKLGYFLFTLGKTLYSTQRKWL